MSGVPSSAPLLVLVKHAQPVLDAARPPREWDLAGEGEQQAERLADALRQYLPFQMVSSPELKARRTSDIVAAKLGITATAAEDLRELDRPLLPVRIFHNGTVLILSLRSARHWSRASG